MAFGLRVALILMAFLSWPSSHSARRGSYLLCLAFGIFKTNPISQLMLTREDARAGFGRTVLTLAITDLAFSIDSVAAAVAISDQICWL